jgi:hypothetical protein
VARQLELVQEGIQPAQADALPAHGGHQLARALGDAVLGVVRQRGGIQQRTYDLGLVAAQVIPQGRAQRALARRSRLLLFQYRVAARHCAAFPSAIFARLSRRFPGGSSTVGPKLQDLPPCNRYHLHGQWRKAALVLAITRRGGPLPPPLALRLGIPGAAGEFRRVLSFRILAVSGR